MKDKISALMDGELERHEAGGVFRQLDAADEAREAWRTYHLIGDVMRDTRMLSEGFAGRVREKLAQEPTVLAPSRTVARPSITRWHALSMAASFAAVALVGWVAFAPQPDAVSGVPMAQVPGGSSPAASIEAVPMAEVAPPETANDYLLAHQGYSPRNSLQGVAPYVRMVSGESMRRKP